jgi:hypothetical protein
MEPLDYPDLVRAENESSLIITDSGGIQEEGAALGKFVLILRENTERPEGVLAGVAELVGTDAARIYAVASARLGVTAVTAASARGIYGDGHAAERIVDTVLWYLRNDAAPPPHAPFSHLRNFTAPPFASSDHMRQGTYDLVLIFTVWRRETLGAYFKLLDRQDLFAKRGPDFRVHVLVFQNGVHVNVTDTVTFWSAAGRWGVRDVTVTHSLSRIATGYFGRFLAPMLSAVRDDTYWIVFDDDVVWGAHYLSNMLRVIDGGRLATRNGRFISYGPPGDDGVPLMRDSAGYSERGWLPGMHASFDVDIPYDYGGHIWGGRVAWLRAAWTAYPPTDLNTAEDFWLSAAVRAALDVRTARARCLRSDVESCACSMQVAHNHSSAEMGAAVGVENARGHSQGMHALSTGYVPLGDSALTFEGLNTLIEPNIWDLRGSVFEGCLHFT